MAEAPVTNDPIVVTVKHPSLGEFSWTLGSHVQKHIDHLVYLGTIHNVSREEIMGDLQAELTGILFDIEHALCTADGMFTEASKLADIAGTHPFADIRLRLSDIKVIYADDFGDDPFADIPVVMLDVGDVLAGLPGAISVDSQQEGEE